MAFQFQADESIAEGIRRIARGQVKNALASLTGPREAGPEAVIHEARKRFKRVRALILLARGGLGHHLADREYDRFRDAGRPLSEVRDAEVLVLTLDGLIERFGDQGRGESIRCVRDELVRRKQEIYRRLVDEGDVLGEVTGLMEKARREVKDWDVTERGWNALAGGLNRIYRQARRAFLEVLTHPTDDNLHEMRKRVKDLWYVFDILQPIRPGYTKIRMEEAEKLADELGNDHDLAVLRETLSGTVEWTCDRNAADVLLPLIDRRRAELRQDATALGHSLLEERPKDFAARIKAFWKAWRAEARASGFESS